MLIINLKGGMGNQMFQYALAAIIAKRNNTELFIDKSFFRIAGVTQHTSRNFELKVFNNDYKEASSEQKMIFRKLSFTNQIKKKLKLNYPKTYYEQSFSFNPEILKLKTPLYLNGYFQSYRYLSGDEIFIKSQFEFSSQKLDENNYRLLNAIKKYNSISVHIRRGDYVNDQSTQKFHGNCGLAYYREALDYFMKEKKAILFFFSDDIAWVKQNFNTLSYNKVFVDQNKNENSWKDMLLMSSCKHNIIANSSFSWWAAWLNSYKNKIIIAPKIWFANPDQERKTEDLIPREWIRL
jgi:hypothetical protein